MWKAESHEAYWSHGKKIRGQQDNLTVTLLSSSENVNSNWADSSELNGYKYEYIRTISGR